MPAASAARMRSLISMPPTVAPDANGTGGAGEIELGDGTRHRFGPGDVIFAEDTAGDGHVTRTLEGTRGFAHLPVPDGFDITRWPLAT